MADEKKAGSFIPDIVEAKTQDDAVKILVAIAEALHITDDFNTLRRYKDELEGFQSRLKDIREELDALSAPYDLRVLNDIRLNLSFLYIDLNDSGLVFNINRSKIYWENRERTAKGSGFLTAKADEELMKKLGSKSVDAIKSAAATTDVYLEWSRLSSYSYGLFTDLRALQTGIDLVTNSIAAIINTEQSIIKRDAK